MSVSVFKSRDEKWVGEGREDDTTKERWKGEREFRFWLKVTCRGICGTQVVLCWLNVIKSTSGLPSPENEDSSPSISSIKVPS